MSSIILAFSTLQPFGDPPSGKLNRSSSLFCSLDPSRPVEPSRHLSATDRKYLAKVKAKFLNARRTASAASAGHFDAKNNVDNAVPVVPDDLDEMEDVIYDRGPQNVGQAKFFGAWLDESVAGRKAGTESGVRQEREKQRIEDEAEAIFSRAMNIFGRGMYKEAQQMFGQASQLIGAESRLGGQYQLWQAQALDAAGNKKGATQLFGILSTHSDSEVRKVSRELLFIITAPKLQLDQNSFLQIPDIDEARSPVTSSLLNLSNFNSKRTSTVEKPPEPHSLQWYLEKEHSQRQEDNSIAQAFAIVTALLGTLAFMVLSSK